MITSTARQTFRETVAAVAALAKAKLPTQVNGRIESAVRLVLAHDVEPQADGSILVGSASDPLKQYRLVGLTCECQDFVYGKDIEGWCQHRIAAGISKRVGELLPQSPPVATGATAPASPAVPAALPEAPASVNVRLVIAGRDCQLTLRDTDEARLLERLHAVLEQYPAPQPQPAAQGHGKDWCALHNTAMPWNEGRQGRTGWHSHRLADGSWCKGK